MLKGCYRPNLKSKTKFEILFGNGSGKTQGQYFNYLEEVHPRDKKSWSKPIETLEDPNPVQHRSK